MSTAVPNVALVPPGPIGPAAPSAPTRAASGASASTPGPSFADVLAQRTSGAQAPQFSRHALERVQRRGIAVDPPTLQRLGDGLSRAAGKGARNAVVFVDNTAFVANVPSNTVITAVDSGHMREHVFTNIDSAVIA